MRKILCMIIIMMLFVAPENTYARFIVESEVQISAESEPAPVEPPVVTDDTTPVIVNPEPEIKKEEPAQTKPEEDITETEADIEEPVAETEEDITETEADIEEPVAETEEEIKESEPEPEPETEKIIVETEEQEALEEATETEEQIPAKKALRIDFKRIAGIFILIAAIAVYMFLVYGYVKIYSLSVNNQYVYIGRCRISKSKGNIRIYISKFALNRGKTSDFKIVISERMMKSKKPHTVFLILPGQEKIEVGLRKEIEFQYN